MGKDIDYSKIAFIICYNNIEYLQECVAYINNLYIPKGVKIDIIGLNQATSITSAYNAAMKSSDAKYKVYLHQDTFIINLEFISKVIQLFKENPDYGMLGILGSDQVVENANYCSKWNVGKTLLYNASLSMIVELDKDFYKDIQDVIAIDGMIMITQYDVEWREDIFKEFDFYDISQSMEFFLKGYKIGVVNQKKPWCIHDCGKSNMDNYDKNRYIFCNHYKNMGYVYSENISNQKQILQVEKAKKYVKHMKQELDIYTVQQQLQTLKEALTITLFSNEICKRYVAFELYISILKVDTNFYATFEEMKDLFRKYKFLTWRLEYDVGVNEYVYLLNGNQEIIKAILGYVLENVCINKEKVLMQLKDKFDIVLT